VNDTIYAKWDGPYSWPKYESENNLPVLPNHSGIYLLTAPYKDGFVIYAAGMTTRPIPKRLREHTLKYRSGDYNILNVEQMSSGARSIEWKGWQWTDEKRAEFQVRKDEIVALANKQLTNLRIFVAAVSSEKRLLFRTEAAIMNQLYSSPAPFCDIPDRGMSLSRRWPEESPITIKNECDSVLYGLPATLEI
jgi:hypothetical protein